MSTKITYLVLVAVIVLSLATGCAQTAQQAGGTFVVGRGGDSVLLDLAAATDGESWRVGGEITEPLIRLEGTTTKPIPWLAESWESKDSQTWIFKIRQNVKFHDGTACDCAAVKWNMDRWRDEKNQWRFGRTFEYYTNEFGEDFAFKEVECTDKNTLKLVLNKPNAVTLAKLSLGAFGIASPKAIQDQKDTYGTAAGTAVGTGPFIFVEWIAGDHITVKRNTSWWGGAPKFERIIWRSIPDNTARFAELKAGKLNQADLAQTDLPAAQADPNLQVYKLPALSTGYISFQQSIKPFDNVKVRQAVAYAMNREALIKPFYGDWGTLATCFQPPAVVGYNPNIKAVPFDTAKAKQLLTEAGYPNGFTTDFWYIPVIRGYFPDSKAIAEAMAIDLAKAGIKVNLKTEDWGAYLADRNAGKFPMWMLGWGSDNGDPDNYIGYHFAHPIGKPKAEDSYANDKLAQLIIDGAVEPDQAKREKIYQEAEQIVYDDMARISVVWVSGSVVYTKNVKGYTPVVFRSWYEKMWLEK
jgi:peptide/nickel transport system substrate-binding protein